MRNIIHYNYILTIYDNQPKPVDRTILDLWKSYQIRRNYRKQFCPLYIPVRLKDPNGGRIDTNVDVVTMGVIDFDDGRLKMPKNLDKFDFISCAYTTHSHTQYHHKWRFMAPLKTPIDAATWSEGGWRSMVLSFGKIAGIDNIMQYVDKSCKNPARAYYYPSAPPDSDDARVIWNLSNTNLWQFEIEKKKKYKHVYKPSRIKVRGDSYNDLDSELANNLKKCPMERADMCALLGGTIINGKCKRWRCPLCGRSDATYYYIRGRQVFCQHMESCSYRGDSLYELATKLGVL